MSRLKRSSPKPRKLKSTILIVGEGRKTEPYYFDGLKREESVSKNFSISVRTGKGGSPRAVVLRARNIARTERQRGLEFDEIWCVMDVENVHMHPALRDALRIADQHGITVFLSNPSFEVWFLAHFVCTHSPCDSCGEVVKILKKHWRKRFRQDYDESNPRIYEMLREEVWQAVKNAQKVREEYHSPNLTTIECNSSTDVYKIVLRLMSEVVD